MESQSSEPMETGECTPSQDNQEHCPDSSTMTDPQEVVQEPDSTTSTFATLQPVVVEPVTVDVCTSMYVDEEPQPMPPGPGFVAGHIAANTGPVQGGQITTTQMPLCPNVKSPPDIKSECQRWDYQGATYAASPMASDASVSSDYSPAQSPSTSQQDDIKCEEKLKTMIQKDSGVKCCLKKLKNPCPMLQQSEAKVGCVTTDPNPCKPSCSAPFLPPCKVCGDRASGFHYGVNTCEPCKLREWSEGCKITTMFKSQMSYCDTYHFVRVGPSEYATEGFFRRSIVKIEHHKEAYKCAMSGKCSLGPGTRHACSFCRYHKCLEVGMSKDAIKTGRYTYEKRTKITQEVKKLEKMGKESQDSDNKEEDSDSIIKELVAVQRRINPLLADYFDGNFDALNEQAAVFEAYMKRIEMFGSMSVLPPEVYKEFYKETGIDVDNRQELMKHIVERMETCITNMVEYVRSVPELKDLTLEDQTALVKASHFEFGFLCMYHGFNTDLNVVTCDHSSGEHLSIHKEDAAKVVDKTFLDDIFQCAKTFKNLKLTEEEVALMRGIVITFRDRCQLQEPDRVEQIQWRLINCLRYFNKNRGLNPNQRLCQIFDRLTALRSLSEMCRKLDREKAEWSAIKDHPLVLDVITS